MGKGCSKCGTYKPLGDFPGDRRTKDGKASACKACRYAAHTRWRKTEAGAAVFRRLNREYHDRNRDKIRARSREKYAASKAEYYRRTYKANKTPKGKARKFVHNAVRAGRITKPGICARCRAAEPPHRIHAHHADYSKPREVEWLCSVCHGKEHRTT